MSALENAGHRLGSGATTVVTGIAAWPAKAENGEKKTGRWIVLIGSGWLTEQLVAHTHPLALVAAGALLIASWVKGTVPEPAVVTADDADDNVAMVEFILQVIGDRQGVHLVELLPAIQAHTDGWDGCDKTYLRRVLVKTVGLPVRKKLRVGERTGISGVHRDDAQRVLERLTAPPAVDETPEATVEDVDAGRSTQQHVA